MTDLPIRARVANDVQLYLAEQGFELGLEGPYGAIWVRGRVVVTVALLAEGDRLEIQSSREPPRGHWEQARDCFGPHDPDERGKTWRWSAPLRVHDHFVLDSTPDELLREHGIQIHDTSSVTDPFQRLIPDDRE